LPSGRRKRLSRRNFRSKVFHQIYHDFIWPLRRYKSRHQSYKDWLREVFCVQTRSILQYRVIESFRLPGKLFAAPRIPIAGLGHRDIRKGAMVYVRHDITMPDRYDVEHTCTPGRKAEVFLLTDLEWKSIRKKLKGKRFKRVSNSS